MTNTVSYEGNIISTTRSGGSYRVEFADIDVIIYIKKEIVDKIEAYTKVEYYYIALILAYIEYTRITTNAVHDRNPRMLEEDSLIDAISKILLNVDDSIEKILISIRNLKWPEIKGIVQSADPKEIFDEYL